MLPSCSRLLVILALQAALVIVPALDGRVRNRPLDRASVVETEATAVESGLLSQQSAAEQGGVILKSAHDRLAGQAVTELGPKKAVTAPGLQTTGRVGLRWSLSSHLVRLQI